MSKIERIAEALRRSIPHLPVEGKAMVDSQAALQIARARAAENGWAFGEPFSVRLRRGWFKQKDRYEIETNADRLGAKAWFVIDADSGRIVSEGFVPR